MERKKRPGEGRPLKIKSVEELQKSIDRYFKEQDDTGRPYTVTGLARVCGLDRDGLINYGRKEQFADAIKAAKLKVHEYAEERLYGNSVTGIIFTLKNNWGWKDKTEQDLNVKGSLADALREMDRN